MKCDVHPSRGDEPPNPFKVDFASFDPSLSHSAPKTQRCGHMTVMDISVYLGVSNLIPIISSREPVPLSEAKFVVGEGGRISASVRGEDNEIPVDGDFFGPFQSVNLGEQFDPASSNLPVSSYIEYRHRLKSGPKVW